MISLVEMATKPVLLPFIEFSDDREAFGEKGGAPAAEFRSVFFFTIAKALFIFFV